MKGLLRKQRLGEGGILFVSTEPVRPGSAAEMHLDAISSGLEARDFSITRSWEPPTRSGIVKRIVKTHMRAIRAMGPHSAIYFRWHIADTIPIIVAKVLRKPIVLEVNGPHDDVIRAHPGLEAARSLVGALARWQMRRADVVICVSRGLSRWVGEVTGAAEKVHFVPNGAPASLSNRVRAAEQPPYVAFIGDLAPWQRIDLLLAARLSPYWPSNTRIKIVGDGRDRRLVEQAQDEGGVDYYGFLAREKAHEILSGAAVSVSCQSSTDERSAFMGTPFKVAESMMLGVPTVVSDIESQSEPVNASPVGVTYTNDSPDALAKAVSDLIDTDYATRQRLAAYTQVNLSWDKSAAKTASILRTVMYDKPSLPN